MKAIINQKTSFEIESEFIGSNGSPMVPNSIEYRIDCLTNGETVRDWTSIAPSDKVLISITSAENDIIDESHAVEEKLITIKAAYGVGRMITDEFSWYCKNLKKV